MKENSSPYIQKKRDQKLIFFYSISAFVILIALSISYYFVIAKPGIEKKRIEVAEKKLEAEAKAREEQKRIDERLQADMESALRKAELEYLMCQDSAQKEYMAQWEAATKRFDKIDPIYRKENTLPRQVARDLEESKRNMLSQCEKEYKQKIDIIKAKYRRR